MSTRLVAGVLAVACLALGGCGSKEGQRVIEYERGGDRLQEKKANASGRYTLRARDRADVTFRVEKGEKIGFRRGRDTYVEAFAGDNPPVELERRDAAGAYWEFDQKAAR
jgi:hypothetical protein